jgi:hypothetical protein
MNTRGLMQLVILNLGFELRRDQPGTVLDDGGDGHCRRLLLTTPLLEWINPVREQRVESVVRPV